MEGALEKETKERFTAAAGRGNSMSNLIILGTPFMRSNYIRFTHPIGKDPYIMIHDKCPEDMSAKDKAKIEKASNETKVTHKQEGVRMVEVSPHGEVMNYVTGETPTIRKDSDTP